MGNITNFQDIQAWKHAHALVIEIYKTTKSFPKEELYGIVSQIRRATVSIPANIVEGFHRKTNKEKLRFYEIAMSSLEEVKYFILLSKDLSLVEQEQANALQIKCDETGRTLRGWMKLLK